MNSQNILKFWGTYMDLKIDSSEYHDYEISKTESDYNSIQGFEKQKEEERKRDEESNALPFNRKSRK